MTDLKMFSLIAVGSELQIGKGGPRIVENSGSIEFKSHDNLSNTDLLINDLKLTDANSSIIINDDTILSRLQAGVYQFGGSAALSIPAGLSSNRPVPAEASMVRFSTDFSSIEFYNGSKWKSLAPLNYDFIDNTELLYIGINQQYVIVDDIAVDGSILIDGRLIII